MTTTTTTPTELSARFIDAVNKGAIERLDDFLAEDVVDHHLPAEVPAGRAGVKLWCALLHDALQIRVDVLDAVEAGDRVAIRARITGTHVGEFAGVPATGRRFDASFLSIERVADGRIIERWEIVDTATVMAQLLG